MPSENNVFGCARSHVHRVLNPFTVCRQASTQRIFDQSENTVMRWGDIWTVRWVGENSNFSFRIV